MAETSRLDPGNKITGTRFMEILLSWTCDGAGAATVASEHVVGKVHRVVCTPDAGVTPLNDYDVVILDADGHDVLDGNLENQLDTGPSGYILGDPIPVSSILTAVVENAGAAGRKGTILLYVD